MTPQQRQRLENLVAKAGGDGRRHVTLPIDVLAELLGIATATPSEPTTPTPTPSPDPVAVDPPALESPAPPSRRRKPKT